ncbi:30S ribosomal protein S10 [Candidatus Vidania fulgoroideae]|nr:30S ribosomal protein S10 [Candidatus Vidania fulgoroideae]
MKLNIYFFSFNQFFLEKTCLSFKKFLLENGIRNNGPIYFPSKKKLLNILRSPHIDKNSRDQFFYTSYKFLMVIPEIKRSSFRKINSFNLPSSVNAKYVFDIK